MVEQGISNNAYTAAARSVLDFADDIESFVHEGERSVLARACQLLDNFSAVLARDDLPDATIPPARYALAALIDRRVRQQQGVKLSSWGALAHKQLFDGRDMSAARIAEFHKTALDAGPNFAPLAAFLEQLRDRDARGEQVTRHKRSHWGWSAFACVSLFVTALCGYATLLEYKFHAKILDGFRQDEISVGLDLNPQGAELASRLTQLRQAVFRVERAARSAPFRRVIRLPIYDSETVAMQSYHDAVATYVPPALIAGLETEIATQGDGLKLYDALRVWAVLAGNVDWQPGFVTGWMKEVQNTLGWYGFAQHVQALGGPIFDLSPSDTEIMDQARAFAAETSETDRVWLELKRAKGTRGLPHWIASERIAAAGGVLVRRSGLPLDTPVEGLFTQTGWDYARDFGIGIAVQQARRLTLSVLGTDGVQANETPDLVADRLHSETIAYWQSWLADIRVQPFNTRERAILVSGALAQKRNPLTQLLQEVWAQSGGTDRTRAHQQQLQLATTFGPMIQYVETGGMTQVGRLFSALNVALGSVDIDAERGAERLMTLQNRAKSINVLKSAPRIVVQITEDVLSQASSAHDEGSQGNSLTVAWQRNVYAVCRGALEGRYPFTDGPDAALADVSVLLGPNGAILKFFQTYAAAYVDQSISPWRWKPEARFAGLEPESAAFFERAFAISQAMFDADGQMQTDMTLTALAERGTTTIALGGAGVPVRASGAVAQLNWPGPEPSRGVQVSFREATQGAQIDQAGIWGLHKMLDTFRLRFRDKGQRVLIDMRTKQGHVFVEVTLDRPNNPISGRGNLRGFACPPNL